MKIVIALLAILVFMPEAKADVLDISLSFNLLPQIYSSPITEQFSATFDYDSTLGLVVPGTMTTESVGPIDPFNATFTGGVGTPGFPQINWCNVDDDCVQFDWKYVHPYPYDPIDTFIGDSSPTGANMFWYCRSLEMCSIFGDGNTNGSLTVTEAPVATPETGVLAMLLAGLAGLVLLAQIQGLLRTHGSFAPSPHRWRK